MMTHHCNHHAWNGKETFVRGKLGGRKNHESEKWSVVENPAFQTTHELFYWTQSSRNRSLSMFFYKFFQANK